MTAPDPADVAEYLTPEAVEAAAKQLHNTVFTATHGYATHGYHEAWHAAVVDARRSLAAALAVIAPRIRQQSAADERERCLAHVSELQDAAGKLAAQYPVTAMSHAFEAQIEVLAALAALIGDRQ